MRLHQAVLVGLAVLWTGAMARVPDAQAADPPFAAMAIDANTGAVLHNQSGDAPRYPASLTKMMTLYLAFELIEQGRLDYASKIKITEEAAAVAPSKLDLEPGSEISLIDAIKALITKSANDVAVAIAQHIGGTEASFARLMTAKARELGMSHTTFRNASGLPDEGQTTTARDMLTLALRLQDHFPRHYGLFATRTFTFAGHTYRNHNTLLSRYAGAEGIKTGYTRLSGFNLVTSVRRDGKQVVAAVFGGKTAKVRNTKMVALLDKALAKASTQKTRRSPAVARAPQPMPAKPPTVAQAEPRVRSPEAAPPPGPSGGPSIALAKVRPVLMGAGAGKPGVARETTPPRRPTFATAGANASPAPRPTAVARAERQPQVVVGSLPSTLDAQARAIKGGSAPGPARQAALGASGGYAIQIGAYRNLAEAERHMTSVRERAGSLLEPYRGVAVPARSGAQQLYRARFHGFDAAAATSTCLQLRRLQVDCFVVSTQ